MNLNEFIFNLLKQSYLNETGLASQKRKWAKESGLMVSNSQIITGYRKLVAQQQIRPDKKFERLLRLKKIRSLSGIVPLAVLTKPYLCPGKCIYCPTQKGMPKSYLNDEPAVMRAKMANFDPYLQVTRRLNQFKTIGHTTDKVELIIMGGTFSSLPKNYQVWFIANCFVACNQTAPLVISIPKFRERNLVKRKTRSDNIGPRSLISFEITRMLTEQKINETAKHRIIGLTLETRPDQINIKEIKFMRQLGCTRVEIGVQSIYDSVLKKVNRGHTIKETIKATQLLKDAGFKVCYHLMPNLPDSNLKKDFQMFQEIFTNKNFMPDMIKIYPCVVLYQAKLYDWYKKEEFKPYTDKQLIDLLIEIKKIVPEWIRINRLGRDIPVTNIAAGNKISNIRQVLQQKLKEKNLQCQCIRCREIRARKISNLKLEIRNYRASGGNEYFLQYVDKNNRLYALLRLRIPSQIYTKKKHFLPVLQNSAIIRELHTYGEALPIAKEDKQASQHHGLGKKLVKKAEEIVRSLGIKKIVVIAGVGARKYYKKLGYQLEDSYMIKNLF